MKPKLKKLALVSGAFFLVSLSLALVSEYLISAEAARTYDTVQALPHRKVALVLGTARVLPDGYRNLFFDYRIAAALEVYRAGKVDYLIVSGDNGRQSYNEPEEMKKALMDAGVEEDRIYADYAGFRTLDSMVRAKAIFGQSSFIVISQPFHNERALYLGRHYGLDVVGYNARDVSGTNGLKARIREIFARVKCLLDTTLLGTEPRFYGEPIQVGDKDVVMK